SHLVVDHGQRNQCELARVVDVHHSPQLAAGQLARRQQALVAGPCGQSSDEVGLEAVVVAADGADRERCSIAQRHRLNEMAWVAAQAGAAMSEIFVRRYPGRATGPMVDGVHESPSHAWM